MESVLERLSTIPLPPLFTIENGVQKEHTNLTFETILDILKSKHWHSEFDAKGKVETHTCPHKESLFEHLVKVGELCGEKAVQERKANPDKYRLMGFFHDIGKPGVASKLGKRTSFKGHGIVGGALMELFWSEELGQVFGVTKKEWGHMSAAADVHMCGYFHRNSTECGTLNMDCFRLLHEETKDLLVSLRYGDNLGLIPQKDEKEEREKEMEGIVATMPAFTESLFTPLETKTFLETYKLRSGVLIQVQGTSASGKTTFTQKLVNDLERLGVPSQHIHKVNRDRVMINLSRRYMKLPPVEEITAEIYDACYSFYHASKKFYADSINKEMRQQIEDGLSAGHVVITDTMATGYVAPAMSILSSTIDEAFRVSFWMFRNSEIKEEESKGRLGMTLEKQLEVSGDRSLMNPFHPGLQWRTITSLTEAKDMKKLSKSDSIRPHISLSHGWTDMKEEDTQTLLHHIANAYQYNQTLPRLPVLEETMNMNLQELLFFLYKGFGEVGIQTFFRRYNYTVSQPLKETSFWHNVFGIKYIDGVNNIWKPKWAREARGRFYYVDKTKCVCLKESLQRGAEMITKLLTEEGIENTQDISPATLDKFDARQQDLLLTFSKEEQLLNGFLSGKRDGSLLLLTVYPPGSVMKAIVDDLEKRNMEVFWLETEKGIVVPATQGTLFIHESMHSYFLTVMYDMIGLPRPDFSTPPFTVWKDARFQETFKRWICDLCSCMPSFSGNQMTLNFEMICKNRMCYMGNTHTELAVSYSKSHLSLLGVHQNNIYYPHFRLLETKKVVEHPVFLEVKSTSEVFQVMRELSAVVTGKMKKEEFMGKYFPEDVDYELDAEGWVYLDYSTNDESPDYSKLKEPIYYLAHKPRESTLQMLLALPEVSATFFPILRTLHDYFEKLEPKLVEYVSKVYSDILGQIEKGSECYLSLNPKARARVDAYHANPEEKNNLDIIFKMLLNTCKKYMKEVYYKNAVSVYGIDVQAQGDRVETFSLELMMKVQPWKNSIEEKVKGLIESKDDILKLLYTTLIDVPE